MIGVEVGWIAPMLVKLKNDDTLRPTDEDLSWIASLHDLGRIIGTLFTAIFLDRIGRKYSIITCSVLFFLVWLITIFARSIVLIFYLRIMLGVANGISDVVSYIYLAENCSPHVRGIIASISPLFFYIGLVVECTLATYLSYKTTAVVNSCIGFLAFSTYFFLKETPYFLVMKGRDDIAEKNLIWLRGNSYHESGIKEELNKIQQNMQLEKMKKTSLARLATSSENYKSILIIVVFYMLFMTTGGTAITAYAAVILQSSTTFTANEYTILLNAVQLLAACISPFIVERCNRRTMIFSSVFFMALTHICTFILYSTKSIIWRGYFPWLIFSSIASSLFAFSMTYPAICIIRGELVPMSVRAVGNSLSIVVHSLISSMTERLFSPISALYGMEYNFLLYLIASILTCAHVFFFLPETRGKSLVDIHVAKK